MISWVPFHPMIKKTVYDAYSGDLRFHYNYDRYHEALNNLTPADVYYARNREILSRRKRIKKETMVQRKRHNCSLKVA